MAASAGKYLFEERPFFWKDSAVNPDRKQKQLEELLTFVWMLNRQCQGLTAANAGSTAADDEARKHI